MISFIRGTLVGSDSESALIEVNGIGYRVAMSYHALSSLGSKGDEVLVLTYLYVREDALVLYGFVDEEERSLFERLITVSGIPGVGKKTASRIVLELKDALGQSEVGPLFATSAGTPQFFEGAADALLSMGFTQTEAELALKDAPADASESELIRYALKRLGE